MPFSGFDAVYNLFIAKTLMAAGYDVSRADDVQTNQNILKDVVQGIAEADLIVADLTDSNPNVYYELGIAHALRRPVILLTQQLDDLPFDLRSYRVIPYSTHFAEIEQARRQLLDLARATAAGTLPFGNPVTDFVGSPTSHAAQPVAEEAPQPAADEGLLDYLVNLEEGLAALAQILTEYGEETNAIGTFTNEVTNRLPNLIQQGLVRETRALVSGLGQQLSRYADTVADQNDRYAVALGDTRTALEFIVRSQEPSSADEVKQLQTFLSALSQIEANAADGRAGTASLAEVLRALPSIERTFNRARNRTVRELERFVENIEQTAATVVRAREIGETKLRGPGDGGSVEPK